MKIYEESIKSNNDNKKDNDQTYDELAKLLANYLLRDDLDYLTLAESFMIAQYLNPQFWKNNGVILDLSDGHKLFKATSMITDDNKTIKFEISIEEE